MNPLRALFEDFGQAVWLDFIERGMLERGELGRMIAEDGVRGVTSNPSIFNKAIAGGDAYDAAIEALVAEAPEISTEAIYEALAVEDIRAAADALREVYAESEGSDGFVSLEVSPHLAHDADGTVDAARRLWARVDRPNLMIKVPATTAGIPAIETLIGLGINVNATLMFSMRDYESVAVAYIKGLGRCPEPARVASVASFFVSRVDTAVDDQLRRIGGAAAGLLGTAAVANSKLVYERFGELFGGDAFAPLAAAGARVQRPLWASTSTKNPAYSDIKYVEELIGPNTVNTIPMSTLEAFRDHGRPRRTVDEGMAEARRRLAQLPALGIDLDTVTETLQVEGVAAFARAYDELLGVLDQRRSAVAARR